MKHIFGLNEYLFRQKNTKQNIVIDTHELINGHLLLTGMSGTGKSYQASRLISSAIQQSLEIDIFDVHNELDFLTNCGTTILLGIHSSYWDMACRKLQIEKTVLKYIRPKQAAAIKLQRNGGIESKFVNAVINESVFNDDECIEYSA